LHPSGSGKIQTIAFLHFHIILKGRHQNISTRIRIRKKETQIHNTAALYTVPVVPVLVIKIKVCFPLGQVGHRFSRTTQTLPGMVPEMRCSKVVVVRVKASLRTLADRRLVSRYATKKTVIGIREVVKSAGYRYCFYICGCATLWTVALKQPIFKLKKGSQILV
jgi:hypothetical protein